MQAAGLLIENPLLDWGAAQPSRRRPTCAMSDACPGTAGRWP